MSKIGKRPIPKPDNVTINVEKKDNLIVKVKGPRGELVRELAPVVEIEIQDNQIVVKPQDEKNKFSRMMWGTARAVINNMIIGVTQGFKKSLIVKGLGYRAEVKGNKLVLNVGYSHPVEFEIPKTLKVTAEKKAEIIVTVEGNDKEEVGQFAAKVKAVRPPNPYKGTGIMYDGEQIIRKEMKK